MDVDCLVMPIAHTPAQAGRGLGLRSSFGDMELFYV